MDISSNETSFTGSEYCATVNTAHSIDYSMRSEYHFNLEEEQLNTESVELCRNEAQPFNFVEMQESVFELSNYSHFLPAGPRETDMSMDYGYSFTGTAGDTKDPPSYYQTPELNKEPVNFMPRMARVPSQYQLESLTEMYFFDIPRLVPSTIPVQKWSDMENSLIDAETALDTSIPLARPVGHGDAGTMPTTVESEYISQLLY